MKTKQTTRSIKWLNCRTKLTEFEIIKIQTKLSVKLPKSYILLMKKCNGGYPSPSCFDYFDIDLNDIWTTSVGRFLSLTSDTYDNFLDTYKNPPEFFPKGLVAFAENGGGDLICFDYRNENLEPPIVFWNHEADVGKDVSFIANSFKEFLEILNEPKDEEL